MAYQRGIDDGDPPHRLADHRERPRLVPCPHSGKPSCRVTHRGNGPLQRAHLARPIAPSSRDSMRPGSEQSKTTRAHDAARREHGAALLTVPDISHRATLRVTAHPCGRRTIIGGQALPSAVPRFRLSGARRGSARQALATRRAWSHSHRRQARARPPYRPQSLAVSMITGTFDRLRRLLHTSVPGGPGSMRSSSTRSAPLRSNTSSASGPVRQTSDPEAAVGWSLDGGAITRTAMASDRRSPPSFGLT